MIEIRSLKANSASSIYFIKKSYSLLFLKRQVSLLVIVLFLLSSCRVTWVPEYSASLEEQIINGAKKNDLLYLDMLGKKGAERRYANYMDRYNEIAAEINSIELKNEARKKSSEMSTIIENLEKNFQQYKSDHERNSTLPDGEILIYQSQIRAFWKPLLVAERGLKLAK